MASVKQCDRCKKIINHSNGSVELKEQSWRYSMKINLCDDCLHSFYNWLTKGGEKN